jgi:hypothetical protein
VVALQGKDALPSEHDSLVEYRTVLDSPMFALFVPFIAPQTQVDP